MGTSVVPMPENEFRAHTSAREGLALQPSNQEENNGEHHADQDGTGDRKIESGVLAVIQNVARQLTKRQASPPQKHDNAADYHQGYAEDH